MPCQPLIVGDQVLGIACTRGESTRCSSCGTFTRRPKLCDHALTGAATGRTCDRALCDRCAVHVGPNRDLCPAHARAATPVTAGRSSDPSGLITRGEPGATPGPAPKPAARPWR